MAHEVTTKHNLFDEEIPQDTLYVPETIKDKHNFDYVIKTVENNIPLGQDIREEFHLLSKNSIFEHSRKYIYQHIGCVQVAIKPLIDMGIDATILMCHRDIRHNKFEDSLIGTVETSQGQGPVYFNCYQTKWIQYKVMNTCASRVLLKPQRGETTLFITDMTKANKILPEKWVMDKATLSVPKPAPTIEQIKQDNSSKVEITFNRRNSFSSRIEALRSKDGELIQSELPPTTQYQLPNVKDSNDKPVMATPFKTKDVNEEVTSKDIKSLMEQANYTNKYLQVLGESISREKVSPKQKTHEGSASNNKQLKRVQPTTPDLLLEERGKSNFKSFSANNIYEWNIDAQTEYNIMNTLQHMTMVATTYQTSHECSKETIIDILVAGFSGQLKGCATLYCDLSLWKDRSAELLSNLKCRTLADFRWYRDTFLTRKNFLASLPRSLGDKVRDKIRSQSVNGDIPYESLSYGQLISYVQKLALKICQDDKIQRQLAKEKAQTKRDLGSFCEQFGLPDCPKQKKKQSPKKGFQENKTFNKKRFPRRKYSHKHSISKDTNTTKPSIKTKIDDQPSSTDDEDTQEINTLTREQDLLFEAINSIPDSPGKDGFS
ncbi:hypothetical protein JHK87_004182 [Glycine soja]|nr:hypothetical protein JHK87_004182 [Glycine soja]